MSEPVYGYSDMPEPIEQRDAHIRELEAELADYRKLINPDGTLTAHAEHLDMLRDAMHALTQVASLGNEVLRLGERAEAAAKAVTQ